MLEHSSRRPLSRRILLAAAGAVPAVLASRRALAQAQPAPNAQLGTPASTITSPPRDWTPGRPSIYPDPDVIVVDPAFNGVRLGNSPIRQAIPSTIRAGNCPARISSGASCTGSMTAR